MAVNHHGGSAVATAGTDPTAPPGTTRLALIPSHYDAQWQKWCAVYADNEGWEIVDSKAESYLQAFPVSVDQSDYKHHMKDGHVPKTDL